MVLRSLRGDRAFQRLRKGRPGRGRLVAVRWMPLSSPPPVRPNAKERPSKLEPSPPYKAEVRVGIVVSKKVGKAVVRNKVRRRLREILRRMHLPSCELVVVAQPEAAGASFAELLRDLTQALKKAGLVQ
ncbi:MAG: ribonuclease P protein component [Deinococcota bacterium]|nr:ribonuclease P protein component [Allomeiothermus silvanus]